MRWVGDQGQKVLQSYFRYDGYVAGNLLLHQLSEEVWQYPDLVQLRAPVVKDAYGQSLMARAMKEASMVV